MEKTKFWAIIDASRDAAEGDAEAQLETLSEALAALSPDDIVAFDRILSQHHIRAYDWALWGAAYVIGGGCSDDGFMDFRGWLISRGEQVYEAALIDPESLVDVVMDDEDCQVEGYQYIASQVWEETTGREADEFPEHDLAYQVEPTGAPWEEEDLESQFPKLCKRFF